MWIPGLSPEAAWKVFIGAWSRLARGRKSGTLGSGLSDFEYSDNTQIESTYTKPQFIHTYMYMHTYIHLHIYIYIILRVYIYIYTYTDIHLDSFIIYGSVSIFIYV